ncbi:hypothetical protein CTAYLR_001143 [Chrysophaeum taylorii]|uniref:Uncharacterized protein n=1 Tax=Chrysophaeum taylorii TaxID=2483200 RepID=A0AAD7UPS3_9STRA|nr:hypothetical protein CTAYLR_001143 [Chrysophaeum taylorii]
MGNAESFACECAACQCSDCHCVGDIMAGDPFEDFDEECACLHGCVAIWNQLSRDLKGVVRATNTAVVSFRKEMGAGMHLLGAQAGRDGPRKFDAAALERETLDEVFAGLACKIDEIEADAADKVQQLRRLTDALGDGDACCTRNHRALSDAVKRAVDREDWVELRLVASGLVCSNRVLLATLIRAFATRALCAVIREPLCALADRNERTLQLFLPPPSAYQGTTWVKSRAKQLHQAFTIVHNTCPLIKAKLKTFVTVLTVAECGVAAYAQEHPDLAIATTVVTP